MKFSNEWFPRTLAKNVVKSCRQRERERDHETPDTSWGNNKKHMNEIQLAEFFTLLETLKIHLHVEWCGNGKKKKCSSNQIAEL